MNLKLKLTELLLGVNPKQFARKLSSHADIVSELINQTAQYAPKNISEQVYIIFNGPPIQKACGKYPQFNTFTIGYRGFCGGKSTCECARTSQSTIMKEIRRSESDDNKIARLNKQKNTNIERYGFENAGSNLEVRKKVSNTMMEKYGYNSPLECPDILDKISNTMLDRYGVAYPFQSSEIRNKANVTNLTRYDGLMTHARIAVYKKYDGNPFSDPKIKEKIKTTLIDRYNRTHPKQIQLTDEQLSILTNEDKFSNLVTGKTLTLAGHILGVDATTIARYCDYYDKRHVLTTKSSINEYIIKTILDELSIKYIQNTKKIIPPFELDFYLPDYNSAIEVGSLFYHSEINAGRGRTYHWNKWLACSTMNISLYQWFDDEITNKIDIIKSKILYMTSNINTSIGARHIVMKKVSVQDERMFLDSNHIQGFSKDRQYVIGGYYGDVLISIMTFATRGSYIELTRFATNINANYPGLFSKMLKYSCNTLPPGDILSFSANCHSNGNVYEASGFILSHYVKPSEFYTKNYHEKFNKKGFTKTKLLKKYPDIDITKTEWALMRELGYDRIWDAGKVAWKFVR